MQGLRQRYFQWIVSLVKPRGRYRKLLMFLDSVDFDYQIERDGNRYEDGISLRYRFGFEEDIPRPVVSYKLDVRQCSVLEMMVALALRCEETIMDDVSVGDRTDKWFWGMLDSMGLADMTDDIFWQFKAEEIVNRMLERKYARNGRGGLFTVSRTDVDMRDEEIWYQAMWFFNEEIDDEKIKSVL